MLSSIIIIAILADSGEGRRFLCPCSSRGRNPKSVFYDGDFVLLVVEGDFACNLDSEI